MRCWSGWSGEVDRLSFLEADADVLHALGEEMREGDFHGEMEAKEKMNW